MSITISNSFNIHNNACKNFSYYPVRFWSKLCNYNPDVLANTPTLIKMNGYPFEAYTITTQDGYILTIFRILPLNKKYHQPVFLMHGIITNPEIWVYLGNRSLAFNLADEGYDVWLGTVRGTTFAQTHVRYNMSRKEYWNFNLDSLAYFDLRAQLKFVASKTGKRSSIIYLGHSMGTTLAFMYASGYPGEANSLLSTIIALAPVVYLKESKLVEALVEMAPALERELNRLHVYGLFHQSAFSNNKIIEMCALLPYLCKELLTHVFGEITNQFRQDELLLLFSQSPAPVSVQVLKHYMQLAQTGLLRRYDYGKLKNIEIYHLSEPRKYDLRNIRMPVYLFYGRGDALVSEKDVEKLFGRLGSTRKRLQHIPKNSDKAPFNHLDFFMAKDIRQYLYTELFYVMKEQIKGN